MLRVERAKSKRIFYQDSDSECADLTKHHILIIAGKSHEFSYLGVWMRGEGSAKAAS